MEWQISLENDLKEVALWIVNQMRETPVFLLEGDLGSGKTTLVKYICKELKTSDIVQSPTFSIVHEYQTNLDQEGYSDRIYHMDLYRIKNLDEALQIGIEEYLYDAHVCFIEWPEVIYPILTPRYLIVKIEVISGERRKIRILNHLHDMDTSLKSIQ